MTSRRMRRVGLLLTIGSLVVIAFTMAEMFRRLAERDVPMVWFGEPALGEEFEYLGRRVEVSATGEKRAATDRSAAAPTQVTVSWRGGQAEFSIPVPIDDRLPGLLRYGDWFKIMPMALLPHSGPGVVDGLLRGIQEGEVQPRLIIAVRQLPPGFDPETWGAVRRKAWSYIFFELFPEGPEADAIRRTDRTYDELQDMAELFFGTLDAEHGSVLKGGPERFAREAIAIRDQFGERPGDEALWIAAERVLADSASGAQASIKPLREELRSRFWQYQAMLMVTPKLHQPRTKVVDYGISSMGWTWPVAGVSVLVLTLGIWMLMTSRVSRIPD